MATSLPVQARKLLSPVGNGSNSHQAHENAAEAAWVRIAEEFRDIREALAGLCEQTTRHFEANLREHFAVTCAHSTEVTLQRADADLQRAGGSIESCVTMSQRRGNGRADDMNWRRADSSHRQVRRKACALFEKRPDAAKLYPCGRPIWPLPAKNFRQKRSNEIGQAPHAQMTRQ